tara:strand:- start:2044 stop:2229 length:186 start_codon:yes stop_codon:yes gene_type:complete
MLFRDNNGKIVEISRLNYNNDEIYYEKLRKLVKTHTAKEDNKKTFDIKNTKQYESLLNKIM